MGVFTWGRRKYENMYIQSYIFAKDRILHSYKIYFRHILAHAEVYGLPDAFPSVEPTLTLDIP